MDIFDWIKQRIYEQAYKKDKIEELITSESTPLVEHLIKVLKWEDSINNKKHIRDIDQKWLDRIQDIVRKSKIRLKQGFISKLILEENMYDFQYFMKKLNKRYDINFGGELKSYRTDSEVEYCLKQILENLSERLYTFQATKSPIFIKDVFEDLDINIYGI